MSSSLKLSNILKKFAHYSLSTIYRTSSVLKYNQRIIKEVEKCFSLYSEKAAAERLLSLKI